MERFTISLDAELARAFDEFIRVRGYSNRSEAVRDMLRSMSTITMNATWPSASPNSSTIITIWLFRRCTPISIATSAWKAFSCVEIWQVRAFADALVAQCGVRHGQLNLITSDAVRPAYRYIGRKP